MELGRLLDSLRRAVKLQPDDEVLRTHLATLLVSAGEHQEAVAHLGLLLAGDPSDPELLDLMAEAMTRSDPTRPPAPAGEAAGHPSAGGVGPAGAAADETFDWGAAEQDLKAGLAHEPVETKLRLSDVGGLDEVKERIESSFLLPLRNPELRARYGKQLRGGLLLYGPPGCGKTYLARAVAGELGARFVAVSLAEVLSRWVGQSENNIAELFRYARSLAPCVIFFDEVDAIGHKRSGLGASGGALRGTINQLLSELDGVGSGNEGLFVLGATNAPWDVDPALRRPGRFDRAVFVEPPDAQARVEILRTHLAGLPLAGDVDLGSIALRTQRFSGADLAHAAQSAAEAGLALAVRSGDSARPIGQAELLAAVAGITPSTGRWFEAARNVILFADAAGEYNQLRDYMKSHKML